MLIEGKIFRQPELAYSNSGNAWIKLTLYTRSAYKDEAGDWKTRNSAFIECRAFGALAEDIADNITESDSVILDGEFNTSTTEKDGVKKSYLNFMLSKVYKKIGGGGDNAGVPQKPAEKREFKVYDTAPKNEGEKMTLDEYNKRHSTEQVEAPF